MSAEPPQSFPHNALWRKLRRRYFVKSFPTLFGGAMFLLPAICGVTWLWRGPLWPWLTVGIGILWALWSAFFALMMMSVLTQQAGRGASLTPSQRTGFLFSGLVNGIVPLALLMGRVDWAFYSTFGLTYLSELWNHGNPIQRRMLRLALAATLCLAFAAHAAWLVVLLLLLNALQSQGRRTSLTEQIRLRPTRAEYVTRNREACAAGGG